MLDGVVLSTDGQERIAASAAGAPEEASAIGAEIAGRLLDQAPPR